MTSIKKNRPIGENQRDSGVTGLIQQLYDRGYADAEEDALNKENQSLEERVTKLEQQLRKQDDSTS